jgi:hypothetical protein
MGSRHAASAALVQACLLGLVRLAKVTDNLLLSLQFTPCATFKHTKLFADVHAFLANASFAPVVAFLHSVD